MSTTPEPVLNRSLKDGIAPVLVMIAEPVDGKLLIPQDLEMSCRGSGWEGI